MNTLIDWTDHATRWALGLALGFPFALLVLHELQHRLNRAGSPWARIARSAKILLLPAAALAVLLRFVANRAGDDTLVLMAVTAFWVILLWVLLDVLDRFLFARGTEASWRANIPALFRDMVRSLLVGAGAAVIYSQVWGKDFAGALAALGLGSLVLGLALQEPLGNVFSGIMLLFERPLNNGDWISVDGRTGRVTEMNWRAVGIETVTSETIIVPNSVLYKTTFSNLSRPTPVRTEVIEIGFGYDEPPARVKAVLMDLLKSVPAILPTPVPTVRLADYKDYSILYRLEFCVPNQDAVRSVRDEVLSRLWYVCQRHGLEIPYPIAIEVGEEMRHMAARRAVNVAGLLAPYPQFLPAAGTGGLRIAHYTAGEILLTEGDQFDGLILVINGSARLSARNTAGLDQDAGFIGPGDFIGEHSMLAGQPSPLEARALEDVRAIVYDLETARTVIDSSPALARRVGETIEARRRAVTAIKRSRSKGATAP
jgi:small-conductance mechanosensitive channel